MESGQHRPYLWEWPFLHFTHAGKQASWPCFQEKSKVWIFMYNLLILMLATNFIFPPKKVCVRLVQRLSVYDFITTQIYTGIFTTHVGSAVQYLPILELIQQAGRQGSKTLVFQSPSTLPDNFHFQNATVPLETSCDLLCLSERWPSY